MPTLAEQLAAADRFADRILDKIIDDMGLKVLSLDDERQDEIPVVSLGQGEYRKDYVPALRGESQDARRHEIDVGKSVLDEINFPV